MEQNQFDIIVLGAGHAGVEAAYIASQFPLRVAMVTLPGVEIASAPCNPAIGGVGKGQVVREIDALGGLMGQLADRAGIQYRTLNDSKGAAVQGTRIQIDKDLYPKIAEQELNKIENLTIIRQKVQSIRPVDGGFEISGSIGPKYFCQQLVITLGTFLAGKMHCGSEQTIGGRVGQQSSLSMDNLFLNIKTAQKRFKTGTPPRIKGETINFDKLEIQPSDGQTLNFHLAHNPFQRFIDQKNCYLTRTNEQTIGIIAENKHLSPMYSGQINAIGARYCPSLEDKVDRYPNKTDHHVFLEPETSSEQSYYPSGLSSSLPRDVQESFVHSVAGLEEAQIRVHGYAVEYDVLDTSQLSLTLEHKEIAGLFFAGQVNGTSGYEEAAGQGLVAGLNAALNALNRPSITLKRADSYIGVMIEDLVTQTRDEPYRLFTARCENRLQNREDNAFVRMYCYRLAMGLNSLFDQLLSHFNQQYQILSKICHSYRCPHPIAPEKGNLSFSQILQLPQLEPVQTLTDLLQTHHLQFDIRVIRAVAYTQSYDGYIQRSLKQSAKVNSLDEKKLNLKKILASENISFECKQRISEISPQTFGQLRRMNGLRSSTIALVAGTL